MIARSLPHQLHGMLGGVEVKRPRSSSLQNANLPSSATMRAELLTAKGLQYVWCLYMVCHGVDCVSHEWERDDIFKGKPERGLFWRRKKRRTSLLWRHYEKSGSIQPWIRTWRITTHLQMKMVHEYERM